MADLVTLAFTGATGTVTGSHAVLDIPGARLLLDCGMYQGGREWTERNWGSFPVPPSSIDAVLISHAHIDHTGYLPKLVHDSMTGPVYATAATKELCTLLLPDSAHLMQEEAEYRNRKGATRHNPALPLYTAQDAQVALGRISEVLYDRAVQLRDSASATFRRAGHVLGSATVTVSTPSVTLAFSGDLGRSAPVILAPPAPVPEADYLLIESTYGGRRHDEEDPAVALERAVLTVVQREGVLIIPAFAVGRTQEVLFLLRELEDSKRIPAIPVAVDSPMATDASRLYFSHAEELSTGLRALGGRAMRPQRLKFARSVDESKALNEHDGPAIIISSSGMATGGRVLHHLRRRLPDQRNMVLLVGYQAEGSRGRALQDGADSVRIFGEQVPVRASIAQVRALSAHADVDELLKWLRTAPRQPKGVFLVHGEDDSRTALAARITEELGWKVMVPSFGDRVTLG